MLLCRGAALHYNATICAKFGHFRTHGGQPGARLFEAAFQPTQNLKHQQPPSLAATMPMVVFVGVHIYSFGAVRWGGALPEPAVQQGLAHGEGPAGRDTSRVPLPDHP